MSAPNQTSIHDLVKQEFSSRQAALLQEVSAAITKALKSNQHVVLVTGQGKSESDSRGWKLLLIVIPVLLTAVMGFSVWYAQNKLSNDITSNAQAITTRYVLAQEYKKEQFRAYQQIFMRLSALENTTAAANRGSGTKHDAIAAMDDLDEELRSAEFFLSTDMHKALDNVSLQARSLPPINPNGSIKLQELMQQIAEVKGNIRHEASGEIGH